MQSLLLPSLSDVYLILVVNLGAFGAAFRGERLIWLISSLQAGVYVVILKDIVSYIQLKC